MRGSVAPKLAVRSAAEVHQVLGSGPINLQKASDNRSEPFADALSRYDHGH